MNREEIIRMAEEAGAIHYWHLSNLERFAALVAAAEREACANDKQDAERWRFLVDNSFDREGVTQFHVWEHSWMPHSKTFQPTEWKGRVRGPALQDSIDAAIRARGQE